MSSDKFLLTKILQNHGYTVENNIGEGAQGTCLLIFSQKYKIHFVCKCIHFSYMDQDRIRQHFQREVYSLSHIVHKNIVQIYDFFSEGQFLFMILEYCPNGSLLTVLNKKQQSSTIKNEFNFDYIRKVFIDILSALKYCHEEIRIAHRDIKPANILIDKFGRAKLCDFGLSFIEFKPLDYFKNTVTLENPKTGGTLYFMSPQILHASQNPNFKYNIYSDDIWAFGITAFFILTHTYPFTGRSKNDVFRQQILILKSDQSSKRKTALFSLLPKMTPNDIRMVIERSIVFDEKDRATASDLLNILTPHLESHISLNEANSGKVAQTNPILNPSYLLASPSFQNKRPKILSVTMKGTHVSQSLLQAPEKSLILRPHLGLKI